MTYRNEGRILRQALDMADSHTTEKSK
jgi:hypothetical protein